MEDIDGEITS